MKFLAVLAVAVACAQAGVVSDDVAAPIIKAAYEISPEGNFQYAYETGNGIYAQSAGAVKNPNSEYPSLEVQGAYKYTAPDGTPVETTYVANENGFQPQGSHIPVAPPVPEAILRSLDYIAKNPPPPQKEYSAKVSPAYGG